MAISNSNEGNQIIYIVAGGTLKTGFVYIDFSASDDVDLDIKDLENTKFDELSKYFSLDVKMRYATLSTSDVNDFLQTLKKLDINPIGTSNPNGLYQISLNQILKILKKYSDKIMTIQSYM